MESANDHTMTAVIAGIVSGLMFGVWTIGQTVYQRWEANRRVQKTADAVRQAAAKGAVVGAKAGAAEAIKPVAETVKIIDQNTNGKGEGATGGTGLTARMERVEEAVTELRDGFRELRDKL